MKTFKLLLKDIPQKDSLGMEDKESLKLGKVAFPFKGKTDDTDFDLKKGDEVYYLQGSLTKLDGEEFTLVSLTQLVCQKN